MFSKLKIRLSKWLSNNFQSYLEIISNKKIVNSYNQLLSLNKSKPQKYERLLVDGHFYNLGYFYRLQLLRSAIFSPTLIEHAYIWNYNKKICKNILKSIGIKGITQMGRAYDKDILVEAEIISKRITKPIDIINYKFPEGIPGSYLYDVILKKQRSNKVEIKDKNLKSYIAEFLLSIKLSSDLIAEFKPDIVAISHVVSFQCAPMAYLAVKKGIKTIILCGTSFGTPRFLKLSKTNDLFFGIPHPPKEDIDSIDSSRLDNFKKAGNEYLKKRISGNSNEICGQLAFGRGKNNLDIGDFKYSNKPVIAIYSACWFDFPHTFGMTRFLDVLDWLTATIDVASKNKDVIWLLKPHPAEKWYGGITLGETIKEKLPPNIILLPNEYSGKAVMDVADALINIHGTSAIEYAACGKPVLVADRGWFHDCNFVVFPDSREDYLELLKTKWYEDVNIQEIKANAKLFAGVYFGIPDWQKNGVLPDDSERAKLRKILPNFIKENQHIIKKEIKTIQDWLSSGNIDYHTYKMINSDEIN